MKRINISVNDTTLKQLELLSIERGMNRSSAIRLAIKQFCFTQEVETLSDQGRIPKELLDQLEEYKKDKKLCPNHPASSPLECGCLEDGKLFAKLVTDYNYENGIIQE